MSGGNAGRRSSAFERLKRELRAQRRRCYLCGAPIDYAAKWPDPDSFSVDHRMALSVRPDLAEDPGNLEASHLRCNLAKGAGGAPSSLGSLSEAW